MRENERLIAWLRAHSGRVDYGDQCGHHPPIREMTWSEIAQATDEELGRPYTRQWLQPKCKLLGIETRGRKGLRPWVPPEVQRARGAERWRRWWRRKTQDPEGLEEYYAKRRKNPSRRRRRARLISGASAGGQRYGRSDAEDECIKASLSQEVVPPLDPSLVDRLVRAALEEDGAFRDVTTQALVPPDQRGRGVVLAKGSGVVAGLPVATAAFAALDATVRLTPKLNDGDRVEPGSVIAAVEGPLAPILSAERVALNFLQRLSGVATATRALVDAVAGLPVRIVDTRKTTPGLRALERYAVRVGGGHNHRFNLADGVLIKDNHLAAGRSRGLSLTQVVAAARAGTPHTLRVEVEVTTYAEAEEALAAGTDVILLDNMGVEEMARCVRLAKGRAVTEASGGVTLANVRAIAETGVDVISSGALTHSAPALDISLEIETAPAQTLSGGTGGAAP